MKNETLYNKTVDILVQAYFNDTLQHGSCWACAVGNIVCASLCLPFDEWRRFFGHGWEEVFCTEATTKKQEIRPRNYAGEPKRQIDATGYSWQNLAKIEKAFESASKGWSDEDFMFNGLMAVIDALDEIHENKDTAITFHTKELFVKA